MKIVQFPNPSLFTKGVDVTVFDRELHLLLHLMYVTMLEYGGMGLAANQVELPYNMFVMKGPQDERFFFVNPTIVDRSIVSANYNEGCLSAPGDYVILSERSQWVKVSFMDETGKKYEKVFDDLYSVCVQHEIDHLLGKSHMQSPSIPREVRKKLADKWGLK
jgi:peptide deformylase